MVIYNQSEAKIPWSRLIIFWVIIIVTTFTLLILWPDQKNSILGFAILFILISLSPILSKLLNRTIEIDQDSIKFKNWNGIVKQTNFKSLQSLSCSWIPAPGSNPKGMGTLGLWPKSYMIYLEFHYLDMNNSNEIFTTFMVPPFLLNDIINKIRQIQPNIILEDSIQKVLSKIYDPKYKAY